MNNLKMLKMALNQLKDTGDEWVDNDRGERYKIDDVLAKISKSSVETYSEQIQNELEPLDVRPKLFEELNIVVEGGMVVEVNGLPTDWEYHITDKDIALEGLVDEQTLSKKEW